jgi:hypothetical protein
MNITTDNVLTVQYVAFDKKTGRILNTYSRFSVEANRYVEVSNDELKELLTRCTPVIANLTDQDLANLEILKVGPDDEVPRSGNPVMVDVAHRRIVKKPKLVLAADKREIVGDGQDRATIEIRVVNAEGKPIHTIEDRIKVSVTRGRLSARGGIVDLVQGRATITLTSVNETVDRVRVQATSLTGACGSGNLILEFV